MSSILKYQTKSAPVTALRVPEEGAHKPPHGGAAFQIELERFLDGIEWFYMDDADGDVAVQIGGSFECIEPGDWLVRNGHGELSTRTNEAFGRLYELVPEGAAG